MLIFPASFPGFGYCTTIGLDRSILIVVEKLTRACFSNLHSKTYYITYRNNKYIEIY
jgi:hypothetical protein